MQLLLHLYIYDTSALEQHCQDPRSCEYGSASRKLLGPARFLEEAWTLRFNRIGSHNSFHNCTVMRITSASANCPTVASFRMQDYIIGLFSDLFSQHQVTVFSENSLCKHRQQVSKDMTEGRRKISSTIKKTGVGYSDQSRLIRPVRVARPGSTMESSARVPHKWYFHWTDPRQHSLCLRCLCRHSPISSVLSPGPTLGTASPKAL